MEWYKKIIKLPVFLVVLIIAILVAMEGGTIYLINQNTSRESVFTVDSVASIRMLDHMHYSKAATTGYHQPGDGGGASYYCDTADTTSKDNGGTVLVATDGARWKRIATGPVSLRQFGATGDGRTDDTDSIQSWLSAIPKGETGYAPSGRYKFTSALKAPSRSKVGISGDGSQQTVFWYAGEAADIDLLTIGEETVFFTGWSLEGFSIDSNTTMTAGTALHIKKMQGGTRIRDVSISALNTTKKVWDGVWFDRCNVTTYETFEINVKNEALIVSGTETDDSASDLSLDKGTITFPAIGIHIAGGFGGLYVGQVLVYGAQVNYLQDNARAKRGNREIVLSDFCVLDAGYQYNLHINDKLSLRSPVQINAFITGAGWIAPANPGDGIFIESLPTGRVSIGSAQVKSNVRYGIHIADPSTVIRIGSTTYVIDSGAWGIYADSKSSNIRFDGTAINNTGGDMNAEAQGK